MPNILISNNFYQGTSEACIIDVTPPVFAGIVTASVQSRGQIRATWAAATDLALPLRYEIYAQANTATGLFSNPNNVVGITNALQFDFFTLRDGSFLVNGTTYYVGVRARDGVSNIDSNLVSIGVISTGVFTSADQYDIDGAFAINSSNQFQGTIWALKNSQLATSSNAVMGTASYVIYDKNGTLVSGMSQSGITADANGQYKITPVTSTLVTTLDHYMVKVSITIDGALREGYVKLIEPIPEYEVNGSFSLNASNQLISSFWITADEQLITNPSRLGTAAYVIYDSTGALVSGMSQSGITADSNGLYEITPISSTLDPDLSLYFVKVTVTVDGVPRIQMLPIVGKSPEYEARGIFSINALNQFQGTLWATSNGIVATGAALGTANYTVYDAAGNAVSGLTQSGIIADVNGRYSITPTTAILLTDLTHYSVKIGIIVDGLERVSYRGFTLLGN